MTVGELTALLTVDDRAVRPALRRAENALRDAGDQMADDAEDAGERAGDALGGGFVRGADSQWRNMRGELVDAVTAAALEAEAEAHRAGQRAGQRLGDGLGDAATRAARQAGDDAGDAAGDGLADSGGPAADAAGETMGQRLGARLKMAAAGAGLAAGAVLMSGMQQALDQSQITARLGAQLGTTPAVAQKYGRVAGQLFKDAVVTDFQEGADAIKAIAGSGLLPPKATAKQIKSLATNAADLASTFEIDVSLAAQAAGSAVKNGLAKDSREAFDLLAKGMTGLGPAGEDLAETFREYGPIFQSAGLSGQTALGLIRQGVEGGWVQDTDKIADAFKELNLRATEGSKGVQDALKDLGLPAKQIGDDMAAGGKKGEAAMGLILDKLRELGPNTQEAKQIVSTLFGGPGEDLGAALFALDVDKASAAMGGAKGAADDLGTGLRDNAGAKVMAFKQTLQQGLVDFLGTSVIPRLSTFFGFVRDNSGVFSAAAVGVLALGGAFSIAAIGVWAMNSAMLANPMFWIIAGIAVALAGLVLLVVTYWDQIKSATGTAWDWVVAKLTWAKDGALAVIAYLAAIPGMVSGYFGQAKDRAVAKSLELVAWLTGLPGRVTGAISGLGSQLAAAASRHWQQFKDGSTRKAGELVTWLTGLPGRMATAVGDLTQLLYSKGADVVRGLWNGIKSMGGWLKETLVGWATSVIPGPIAKALKIASPSKVTKAQGRWIARGLVEGMTGSSRQVKAASAKLADIIADGLAPGKKRAKLLGRVSADTKRLLALASQEERVAARLKTASARLSDLIKDRDKLADSVKSGILGSADITRQAGSRGPAAVLARLQRDRKAAEAFAKSLTALRMKGVRSDLISQIAQAGVDQGAAVAASLASATPAQIKAINKEQAALVSAAGKAGGAAGDAMYAAGIQAARGLVAGLQKEQKSIEAQMLRIAKSMTKAVKKALGIKSPSRVMARLGAFTAQGLVRGIEGERRAVDRTMAGLVSTPAPVDWAMARGRDGGRGGQVDRRSYTTQNTYHLTQREMTVRDLETLQRRQDARARVGRPR
nr:phage tail tape measure protein [Streptomyces sp. SID8352]